MRELPDGWVEIALSEVAEVRLGRQRSPDKASGDHMRPYMRAANVTWSGLDLSDVKEMNFDPREFDIYRLQRGDVLLGEASGSATEVGKPAIWRDEVPGACFQNTVIRVRSRAPLPEYLYLHFLADARAGRFADAGKGIGINHLGADRLSNWPTRLAPLAEQRRIADKLEALTSRSKKAKQALDEVPALLEDFRRSVLAAAFRGDLTADWREQNPDVQPASELLMEIRLQRRLRWEAAEMAKMFAKGKRPTDGKWKEKYEEPAAVDEEGLPELPEGWCWVRFDDVCIGSLYGPRFAADDYVSAPEGVPTLRTTDMDSRGSLRLKDPPRVRVSAEQLQDLGCEDGDLLVTRTGSIGKCAVYDESVGPALASAYLIRFRLLRSMVRPRYLLAALLSPRVQELLGLGATAVTQPNINARTIGAIAIAICGMQEQAEILRILESRWALRDVVETGATESLADLADLDRAILAKAFRGELVPQDPTDEPAAALLDRLRADRAQTPPPRRRR